MKIVYKNNKERNIKVLVYGLLISALIITVGMYEVRLKQAKEAELETCTFVSGLFLGGNFELGALLCLDLIAEPKKGS